jgi:isoamylase
MMEAGRPAPLGAEWDGDGTHFALFSSCAKAVELCLFDERGRETARHRLPGCEQGVWSGYLPGIAPGQRYGYRVHGPFDPSAGLRCNPNKLLIDPYARALEGAFTWSPVVYDYLPGSPAGHHRMSHLDSAPCVPKCIVTGPLDALEGRPDIPWREKVIYEANARGFTMRHPALGEKDRGRLRGLANGEILDYLKALGITSLELQPLQASVDEAFLAARGMRNYWGYNSINFFSVDNRFSGRDGPAEMREMVAAVHDAGLEVILDVVYNHTAEGGARGPSISFRGIDNLAYYRTEKANPGDYVNVTGCGNSLNSSHPVFQDLVIDSLAYWHRELGVDGFRFDLAVTLGRNRRNFYRRHPLLRRMSTDPRLRGVSLIAEPWDIGPDGYRLGQFPAAWSEWNDRYRDGVRCFWRGDPGQTGAFAERLHGSADLFDHDGRGPRSSINFVAAHDGFTLADVVTYEHRHNEANGESNRDGHSHNCSSNYGVEGPTADAAVNRIRRRQRLNMLATLFISQGTPMLLAGDEFGNSQGGNNNAYCQDNETGWVDWAGLEDDPEFTDQVRALIALRKSQPLLRYPDYIHGDEGPEIDWMHVDGTPMEDGEWEASSCFSLHLHDRGSGQSVVILINGGRASRWFGLPPGPRGTDWRVAFQTADPDPVVLEGRKCGLPELTLAVLTGGA